MQITLNQNTLRDLRAQYAAVEAATATAQEMVNVALQTGNAVVARIKAPFDQKLSTILGLNGVEGDAQSGYTVDLDRGVIRPKTKKERDAKPGAAPQQPDTKPEDDAPQAEPAETEDKDPE